MNQEERRRYLLRALLDEDPRYRDWGVPDDPDEQRRLLRGLMNIRLPAPCSAQFLQTQDEYLRQALAERGVTDAETLVPVRPGLCLWQGDITTLRCDAIVNAANSGMTGCWAPLHYCIDNAIHTFAGVQLRAACANLMAAQGHPEPTSQAKVTDGYNLPARYVIHTVGPIANGRPTDTHRRQLAECYRACLDATAKAGLSSIAFCCISTGVFGFPQEEAASIAVATVRRWLNEHPDVPMTVVFNVFSETDESLYRPLLGL